MTTTSNEFASLLGETPGTRRSGSGSGKALRDGSSVAVIGAGPAGSMFSYFALDMAGNIGLDIRVDMFEPRRFCHRGPAGCNHCGGVVSESLVQRLATEGIGLPDEVIQRGVDSYQLHTEVGDVKIATPLMEKRIAAVYRGNGPRDSEPLDTLSFDGYLLGLAEQKGARVIRRLVTDVRRQGERMHVECADQTGADYDLVVLATGVNSRLAEVLESQSGEFRKPARLKTFICEFYLGRQAIREPIGPSMHIFLLDIPRLKFAALIPKGDYVTLCLLGHNVDEQLMDRFFNSSEVQNCFPGGVVPEPACHCYPRINVRPAAPAYADRMVMIGDCGSTRLYKDGIGASYRSAKAAAKATIFHGIGEEDFANWYAPHCRRTNRDNQLGKVVFGFGTLVQKSRLARRGVLRMIANEQIRAEGPRRMSGVLWDLFSGSATYTDIFRRTLHPAYIGGLFWNIVAANLPGDWVKSVHASGEEEDHVRH